MIYDTKDMIKMENASHVSSCLVRPALCLDLEQDVHRVTRHYNSRYF